ncbi:MAG: AbrB/MazE/SpoVT family DNA-binding domain-containing protein [Dehalococcoidia bacterium]
MNVDECQRLASWTRIGEGGRLVIPTMLRQALGMQSGDKVLLEIDGDELHVLTVKAGVQRAQAIMRKYVPEGRMLSEELIAERRAEAARE